MRFLRLPAVILLMILFVSGCSTLVQEPRVLVKQVNLIGIDTSGVDIEFFLEVTNPNNFDLSLLGYTYDLKVMTLPLSSGGNQNPVLFPSGQDRNVRLPVRLTFTELMEIIKRKPDPDRIPYTLDARLHLDSALGSMILPVAQNSTFSIPQEYRPAFLINSLRDALQSLR